MSLLTPEQIAAAQKANLETLFGLTTKAFEGVEKLIELNLQVVKSTLAEGQENAQISFCQSVSQVALLQQRLFVKFTVFTVDTSAVTMTSTSMLMGVDENAKINIAGRGGNG